MGGDFKTGAMAAGANEALVEYLDSQLGSQLGSDPETRTLFLTTASQLVGIVAAELVNGDVYQGAEIAAQATRYNYLRHDQVDAYVDELEGCEARGDCAEIQEKYRALSIAQQDELIALCAADAAVCLANYQDLVDDYDSFRQALDRLGGREVPFRMSLDAGPLLGQYTEAVSIISHEGFAQFLQEQHGLDLELASLISAAAAGAVGGLPARTRAIGQGILNDAQQSNVARFYKKIPANAKENIDVYRLPNGGVAVQATSPGNVPDSKAVYEKQIDSSGRTVQYTKTTYDPSGRIVHVKDKVDGGVFP